METHLPDGANTPLTRTERGLTYPQPALPLPGEAVVVAEGVLWLRLSLPLALDHINVYAIEDGDGWVIVDCGMNNAQTHASWQVAFDGVLGGRPVKGVIVTHLHPDHLGAAGWLCERFNAPLMMSELEYTSARMMIADDAMGPYPAAVTHYRAQGWDEEAIERWRSKFGSFSRELAPVPRQFTRLSQDDTLEIGGREWTVVIGRGHSPEHVCLWRKDDGIFIAGDQILPKISSNIGVWSIEPMADPLGDWLQSLEELKALLPSDLLVLPSHGEPFYGVTERLSVLLRGHEVGLRRLERTLRQPSRCIDAFGALFARPIGPAVLAMATAEALAHLNYLERHGRARRERDADGVEWWNVVEDVL